MGIIKFVLYKSCCWFKYLLSHMGEYVAGLGLSSTWKSSIHANLIYGLAYLMRFLRGWWKSETARQLVAPYNGWTIAFLCQVYVILLCFTHSEPFILHDFVTNQHEIGWDHDLFWVYWSRLIWFIVWAEQDMGCLGVVVGGSSVEQRTHSAQQTATRNVAGNALLAFCLP